MTGAANEAGIEGCIRIRILDATSLVGLSVLGLYHLVDAILRAGKPISRVSWARPRPYDLQYGNRTISWMCSGIARTRFRFPLDRRLEARAPSDGSLFCLIHI